MAKLDSDSIKGDVTPVDLLPAVRTFDPSVKRAFEGFAGSGRWAAGLANAGLAIISHDILQNEAWDCTCPKYRA